MFTNVQLYTSTHTSNFLGHFFILLRSHIASHDLIGTLQWLQAFDKIKVTVGTWHGVRDRQGL